MTAILERGEVGIVLEGEEYVMRPSFTACSTIEKQAGRSLMQLAQDADRHDISIDDMAIVATACIQAWGVANNVTSVAGVQKLRIAELIFEAGTMSITPRIALVLAAAVTGGTNRPQDDARDDALGENPAAMEDSPVVA